MQKCDNVTLAGTICDISRNFNGRKAEHFCATITELEHRTFCQMVLHNDFTVLPAKFVSVVAHRWHHKTAVQACQAG